MATWTLLPAIDLRRGRVVRLMQGDPDREKRYADDPLHVADRWLEAGAEWLHVVNLDGAFDESGRENQGALRRILTTGANVQLGGGLRDYAGIAEVLGLGVCRAVVGTAAVENPDAVECALQAFGSDRIAVGIDARDGRVSTHGWKESAGQTALEMGLQWSNKGLCWAIYTDIYRDGMTTGINLEATSRLAQDTGLQVIASGGVASMADVRAAHDAGLSGIIIGRALYEGHLDLKQALLIGQDQNPHPALLP